MLLLYVTMTNKYHMPKRIKHIVNARPVKTKYQQNESRQNENIRPITSKMAFVLMGFRYNSLLIINLFVFLHYVCCLVFQLDFFCKSASNVGPYGLFWQPALVRCSQMLQLCLLIGRIFIPGASTRKCLQVFQISSSWLHQLLRYGEGPKIKTGSC